MIERCAAGALLALSLLGAAPAAAADWTTFGHDLARTNENPAESNLGPANAPSLREVWAAPLAGVANAQPLVVSGVRLAGGRRAQIVLAATEDGVLSAHDSVTGTRLWRRALGVQPTRCGALPGGRYGISATPVVDRARSLVYAEAGDGRMHAVALGTGRELRRGWPVRVSRAPAREYVWGALALRAGRVYAATSSHCSRTFYRGRIVAIDVRRARAVATWLSLGPHRRGGGMWGWGGVAIDAASGDVFAATADALAPPANGLGADSVHRLTGGLRPRARNRPPTPAVQDAEFGGAPLLLRGRGCPPQLVVAHKSGLMFLYDRDRLAAGPRQAIQIGRPGLLGTFGTYAWSAARRTLFVANNSAGDLPQGLVALRLTVACGLELAWSQPAGPDPGVLSPPVTANGVVYVATGYDRHVLAFAADTGQVLWTSPRLNGGAYGAPTVASGRLFVAGWDGLLHAYAPGP